VTFPELLDAALTGTLSHRPPQLAFVDESLPAECQLLRGASILGLRWLAGRPTALERVASPPPAEPEVLPCVARSAGERLLDILERRPEALTEWLELVRARGMRVPPMRLPDLLEYARYRGAADRARVLDVGGGRMSWLASFNADWRFAAHADPEEQFNVGAWEDRPVALRRWRRRDPARARAMLRETWRSERGEQRAALLQALEVGLSTEDEEFLTLALLDPRRDVREMALRVIRRLPGSHFSQRWISRTRALFELTSGRLVVHEPLDLGAEWIADGLDEHPPKGIGTTPWVLRQVLALTPPHVWPPTVLTAADATDWGDVLRTGLAEAAAAYASAEWCAQLLLTRVDPDYALQLISASRGPWSAEFSRLLLAQLPDVIDKHYAAGVGVLRVGAWRLDPSVLPLAESWLEAQVESERLWLRPTLERLVAILDYRAAMRRELSP
jgi:Family of unknown function (DUF5691)